MAFTMELKLAWQDDVGCGATFIMCVEGARTAKSGAWATVRCGEEPDVTYRREKQLGNPLDPDAAIQKKVAEQLRAGLERAMGEAFARGCLRPEIGTG